MNINGQVQRLLLPREAVLQLEGIAYNQNPL